MAHAIALGSRPELRDGRSTRVPHRGTVPRPGQTGQPALRLTGRGRVVLVVIPLVLAAVALLAAWSALMAPAHAGSEPVQGPGSAVTVTVGPGESLWSIAVSRVPGQDPRVTVSQIRELNSLQGSRVLPGEQILVPSGH